MSFPLYVASRDSATGEWDIFNIAYQLFFVILSSFLAWLIGKKFHLSYLWICLLGAAGCMVPKFLTGILKAFLYDLDSLATVIGLSLLGALVLGFTVFIFSYVLQYFWSKLK